MKISSIILLTFAYRLLVSQSSLPNILSWLDDHNYLETRTEGLVQKTYKVNVQSGQSTPYQETSSKISLPDSLRAFSWGTNPSGAFIIRKSNDIFVYDAIGLRQLTADAAEEKVPTWSPDGNFIAYVKEGNLYVAEVKSNLHKQLTFNGGEDVYNGYASWVYYEEILNRPSKYRAYYWSPDSKNIAYLHTDDRPVPHFPITRSEGVHIKLENEHYPKAGDPNPKVNMEIVNVSSGAITKLPYDDNIDQYTAWPFWTPDSRQLNYQELNRDQNDLKFVAYNLDTKSKSLLFEEKYPTWVEFHENIWYLKDNSFFMIHPLDGWWNIYKYDAVKKSVIQITKFNWRVNDILYVNETKNQIIFTGTGENALNRQLYSIRLDGSGLMQLTQGDGKHYTNLSPNAIHFIDTWSNLATPTQKSVVSIDGKKIRDLGKADDPNKVAGIKTEYFTVPSGDGFDLPVVWSLPSDFETGKAAGKLYPIILNIYGGPDAGTLDNEYEDQTRNPLLNQGVILVSADHRASGKFGKKGLDYMYRNLGKWEINDYAKVCEYIKKMPFIDTTHIAIQGGSYGGYMTALALTKAPNTFTHGISFAPVTDWQLYDNIYTERYMDTPTDNPDGYKDGSVLNYTDKLKGKLMIIHGSTDDNVHMQNTFQLIEKLQLTGKPFDMMIYPNVRHGWGGARAGHLFQIEQNWWKNQGFNAKKPVGKS